MKVHLVWNSPKGDRVIDRLFRLLSDGTGWTYSDHPRADVDINYSALYLDLAQRFSDWRRTPWAAYFSHYEVGTPYKEYFWRFADRLVRARTVTALQYVPMLTGPVFYVPAAIERTLFDIQERKVNPKPVLGVSGFVDPSGRKGEHLLARLVAALEGQMDIVASGDGWPVRKINREFKGLSDFYNSIDVYLCTSLIEGVPLPPLEALSCGIPIIIPRGVGMLDDLPEMEGIWRYEKGNFDDLLKVTRKVARIKPDREVLRATTEPYAPDHWVEAHKKMFKKLDQGSGGIDPLAYMSRDQHGQRGVYYVAYGSPAMHCAYGAITSFKKHLPDIPVAVASEEPRRDHPAYMSMSDEDFDEAQSIFLEMVGLADVMIRHPDEDIGGRLAKVRIYDLAPPEWSYIAYLDADTEILTGETFLWRIVESGWDLAICKNPQRFHIASMMRRSDNGDECDITFRTLGSDQVMQLNGGVFSFQRNDATKDFFHAWETEWRRWGKRDQGALLRALWKHPLKLYVLGNEWNTIVRYNECSPAWLNHYPLTARRWRGVLHYRSDDREAWQAVREFEKVNK